MMIIYVGFLTLIRFLQYGTHLSSLVKKTILYGSDSDDGSDASNMCYMVQGDDPLEVNSESELEEDIDMPYDELVFFCQKLFKTYDLLKIKNEKLKKNNSL